MNVLMADKKANNNRRTRLEGKKSASSSYEQNFDRQWFAHQLRAAGLTQRMIADRPGLDESAVSLMLRGRRRIRLDEASELAAMLGTSYEEVVEHAGVKVPDLGSSGAMPITGYVDAESVVHMKRPPAGPRKTPVPFSGAPNLVALRLVGGGPLEGAVVYYQGGEDMGVDPEATGRLSVVETVDGLRLLAVVRKGYERGHVALADMAGGIIEGCDDVRLSWAAPVVFIKPS